MKFNISLKQYSNETAYWMAKLSELAYLKVSETDSSPFLPGIEKEINEWGQGFDEVISFSNNTTQGFTIKHTDPFTKESAVIITFRGTDQIVDWVNNLNIKDCDYPDCKENQGRVHAGFRSGLDAVWLSIEEILNKPSYKNLPILITGHSLGAALSILCALETKRKGHNVVGVYTFGCPKVYKSNLRRYVKEHIGNITYRFQNNNDIVCRVPHTYTHAGELFYIDHNCELHIKSSRLYRIYDGIKSAITFVRSKDKLNIISDHKIGNYIKALKPKN